MEDKKKITDPDSEDVSEVDVRHIIEWVQSVWAQDDVVPLPRRGATRCTQMHRRLKFGACYNMAA